MIRRKASVSETDSFVASPAQIPMGNSENNFAASKRRRKKKISCLNSCLVRLTLRSGGRTTLSGKTRGYRGSHNKISLSCCVLGTILFIFIAITGIIYNEVQWSDSSNVVVRSLSHIPLEMIQSVVEFRPETEDALPILFLRNDKPRSRHFHHSRSDGRFYYPSPLEKEGRRESEYMDFGGVDIKLLANPKQERQIYVLVEDLQSEYRSLDQERDDDYEIYWNFDDDKERNPYLLFDDYDDSMDGRCRRTSWHRYVFPTCNLMHELDLVTNTPRFVGDGAYREVFVTKQPLMDTLQQVIFKELRWDLDFAYDDFEYVRMDAFVTERLTSNQHISDIYGHCGLSMLTEYFAHGDIEDDVVGWPHHRKDFNPLKEEELWTYNNFTASQKLKLALAMVEPVAALHNYKDGVIVHDDIQLCQYLWTDETKTNIKLNDFNRAEIMLWDEQEQKYCKYKNGRGHGDWRAPEEYKDFPLDEKIDIWSLGNNFYSLLTGLYPFFNVEKDKDIQKKIKAGQTALIDPRFIDSSFAEAKLAELIELCYTYQPDDRPNINQIAKFLVEAIQEDEVRQKRAAEQQAKEDEQAKIEAQKRAEEDAAKRDEIQQRQKEEQKSQIEEEQRARKKGKHDREELERQKEEDLRTAKEEEIQRRDVQEKVKPELHKPIDAKRNVDQPEENRAIEM